MVRGSSMDKNVEKYGMTSHPGCDSVFSALVFAPPRNKKVVQTQKKSVCFVFHGKISFWSSSEKSKMLDFVDCYYYGGS